MYVEVEMMVKKYMELYFGVIILVVCAFYFIGTMQVQSKGDVIDSRTVPMILSWIMLILGVLQVLAGLKKAKEFTSSGSEDVASAKPDMKTVAKVGIIIVLYITLFQPVGFMIMTALFLFAMFYILSPSYQKPNLILYGVISVVVSVGVYMLFRYGLDIMLPQGIIRGV